MGRKFLLLAFGCILALLLLESVLRVYAPFKLRVRGNDIVLPINSEHVVHNDGHSPKLDSRIIVRKNSLGFRGAEPPEAFEEHITLVTIGGSTTECIYLTEGKTWPDRLGQHFKKDFTDIWINNAGLDGHSTFGHLALLQRYLVDLRPDIAIFLVGNNDQERGSPNHKDIGLRSGGLDWTSFTRFVESVSQYSDTVAVTVALLRYKRAIDLELVYRGQVDLTRLPTVLELSSYERARLKTVHQKNHLAPYRHRLLEIVKVSRSHGIEPVFVTQPGLYGPAIDDVTGINLATIERNGIDGNSAWEILELYNDMTRNVGTEKDVLVVDLARALPKNSLLFYDLVHYTNEGAVEIGKILYRDLYPFLAKRFPIHLTKD